MNITSFTSEQKERLAASIMQEMELEEIFNRPHDPEAITLSKSDLYKSCRAPHEFHLSKGQVNLLSQSPQREWLDEYLEKAGWNESREQNAADSGTVVDYRKLQRGGGIRVVVDALGGVVILEVDVGPDRNRTAQALYIKTKDDKRYRILLRKTPTMYKGQCLLGSPEIQALQSSSSQLVLV